MKLEDIKLGMKVLITKDSEENGWEKLDEDTKEKFIGKPCTVIGIRLPWINSFPLSSLEPCILPYWPNVGDTISFMNGSQQEVGTIVQYGVEKENGDYGDCRLFIEIKKDNGDIKYAMISSDCVIGKTDPNKSVH